MALGWGCHVTSLEQAAAVTLGSITFRTPVPIASLRQAAVVTLGCIGTYLVTIGTSTPITLLVVTVYHDRGESR